MTGGKSYESEKRVGNRACKMYNFVYTHSFLALKDSANSLTLRREARSHIMASTLALCCRDRKHKSMILKPSSNSNKATGSPPLFMVFANCHCYGSTFSKKKKKKSYHKVHVQMIKTFAVSNATGLLSQNKDLPMCEW